MYLYITDDLLERAVTEAGALSVKMVGTLALFQLMWETKKIQNFLENFKDTGGEGDGECTSTS